MNTNSLNLVVQLVTLVALIFGVALVVWELQQNREMVKAQLESDSYISRKERFLAGYGENPSEIFAKACDQPNELTRADLMTLSSYFNSILLEPIRRILISQKSNLYSEDEWKRIAVIEFAEIFGSHPGRVWWRNVRNAYAESRPELTALGNQIFQQFESMGTSCIPGFYEKYKETVGHVDN